MDMKKGITPCYAMKLLKGPFKFKVEVMMVTLCSRMRTAKELVPPPMSRPMRRPPSFRATTCSTVGEIHSAGGRRPAYPATTLPPIEVEAVETIGVVGVQWMLPSVGCVQRDCGNGIGSVAFSGPLAKHVQKQSGIR
jgi:hypothetical protein